MYISILAHNGRDSPIIGETSSPIIGETNSPIIGETNSPIIGETRYIGENRVRLIYYYKACSSVSVAWVMWRLPFDDYFNGKRWKSKGNFKFLEGG